LIHVRMPSIYVITYFSWFKSHAHVPLLALLIFQMFFYPKLLYVLSMI